VVTVQLDEPTMEVSVRGNVGIVSLTPSAKLRINPKIEWDHIFEMLIAVRGRKRSVEYHGIPLSEFQRDNVDLEDIFLILAINFLNGLEAIHRNGFVRRLETRRIDLEDPRGVIDVERTLVNQAEGRLETHCLLKQVEYDNAVNSLLHHAGTHLLRLFRQHESEYDHQAYYHVFSQIHEEVRHLEDLGVGSDWRRMPEYQGFTLYDLPSQRHYYEHAVDVAKAVTASSLGTPSVEGDRELVVDYVLNKESLFEQYTQIAVEQELSSIQKQDHTGRTRDIVAVRSPTVRPFAARPRVHHQPDHAIEEDNDTLAVLDSKYYARESNPVTEGSSRSNLFSYAYLLDSPHMGFLTPLGQSMSLNIDQTGAELQVVAPSDRKFTLEGYHRAIKTYLQHTISRRYPEIEIYQAVEEHALCLDHPDAAALDRLTDTDGPFGFGQVDEFTLRVVNAAVESLSRSASTKADLQDYGDWTRARIKKRCRDHAPETTTCVPVFQRRGRSEKIYLYFVKHGPSGEPTSVKMEGGYKLL
jgi:5-methylcytosine-specific restriction endonuclease McrBC regulatory subunit McrC